MRSIMIPGFPMGKQRPRFANGRAYTPEKTRNYEQVVRWCWRNTYGAQRFDDDAKIAADICAYMPIPKSATKKRHGLLLDSFAAKKPDCDNIAKIVLDALNGIAYRDDASVVELRVSKHYSDAPRVVVSLWEVEECKER